MGLGKRIRLIRKEQNRTQDEIANACGFTKSFAGERRDKIIQPYLITAKRGEVKQHPLSHEGEEFIYMISGTMHYRVGTTDYTISSGDAIYVLEMDVTPECGCYIHS